MYRARFWVVRAINQAVNAGMHHRSGAHGARFNCNKQVAVFQTMVTNRGTGFAKRHDLGVRAGIGIRNVAVPSPAYNASVTYDDRANRNLSGFQSSLRAAEGFFHPDFIRGKLVGSGLRC